MEFLHRRPNAEEYAERRPRRRIAAGALPFLRQTRDVLRLLANDAHVVDRDADVLGGDVGAVQALNVPAELAELLRGSGPIVGGENDGFAAAEREAGNRILIGHSPGEAKHVGQRVRARRVLPAPAATGGGAQGRRMHGNDGA